MLKHFLIIKTWIWRKTVCTTRYVVQLSFISWSPSVFLRGNLIPSWLYRHTHFIAFCFITFQRYCSVCLTNWRFGNPVSSNFICAISSTAICSLCDCHILVFLEIFQLFIMFITVNLWSVISDVTTAKILWLTEGSDDS